MTAFQPDAWARTADVKACWATCTAPQDVAGRRRRRRNPLQPGHHAHCDPADAADDPGRHADGGHALLPIIVVISGYSLSMLAVGAIGIFTINFWTVLWKFAQWVDENLTVAMHPGSLDGLMNWAAAPGGFAVARPASALMLDTMLAMFSDRDAGALTMMMAWAGIIGLIDLRTWRPGGKVRVNQGKCQELRPVPLRGLPQIVGNPPPG